MKKIKVYFFSPSSYPYFYPNSGITSGGAELQMCLLAKELAKNNNYEVYFFVGNYGQAKFDTIDNVNLIRCFRIPKSESAANKIIKAVKYFFLLAKHKPDVVITTAANSMVGLTAFYKKLLKYKYVHRTAHTKDVDKSFINDNGIIGRIYKYGILHSDAILSQNKNHCDLLKTNHNISAIEFKNIISPSENTNINNKNGVLWVARFEKWKQPFLFIDIVKKMPQVKFTMICPYDKNDKLSWKKLEEECKPLKNIELIEKVMFEKIQVYFDEAAMFVNTSQYEGFPNTFLQAAAAKTPIVSLNVNPDNFLNKYNCGIFCNNNLEVMLDAIKELQQNQNKAREMGENAYNYLIENHNPNIIGKQFSEVIMGLFNRKLRVEN